MEDLAARLAGGAAIYLHGTQGAGRPGMVGACLLVRLYGCGALRRARPRALGCCCRGVRLFLGGTAQRVRTPGVHSAAVCWWRGKQHATRANTLRRLPAAEALERVQRAHDARCAGGEGLSPATPEQRAAVEAYAASRRGQ